MLIRLMNTKRVSRLIIVACCVTALLAAPWWLHAMQAKNLRMRASWLHAGDSPDRITEILGAPSPAPDDSATTKVLHYRTSMQHWTTPVLAWLHENMWSAVPGTSGEPIVKITLDDDGRVKLVKVY